MRSLALELRPPLLETAGVDATLRWLAGKQQQATGAVVEVRGHLDEVPEELATALFRVAQEALTNVARHAQAKHVWIDLSQEENAVEMAIRDDGIGFDVASTVARAAADDRLGHLGMRERVDLLGGTLAVDSAPGRGTSIRISIPMPVAAVGPHRTDAGARG
jgi:two-component system sensor histidine kinase UhpB